MRRSKYLIILGACCFLGAQFASLSRADAAPAAFGTSFYEFVEVADPFTGQNNTWATANAAAAASTYNGQNGYLATITSQAENDFLFGLTAGSYTGFTGAWIGGKSPEGWLTGPEAGQGFTYTNWGGVEPNNNGYAYMNIGSAAFGINPGEWPDGNGTPSGGDPVIGYFVEYPLPEPSAALLLGFGSLALLLRRRQ